MSEQRATHRLAESAAGWIGAASIARALDLPLTTVERMRRAGEIPSHQLGAELITLTAEFASWLDGRPESDELPLLADPASNGEVAAYLGVATGTVRGWVETGLLDAETQGISRLAVARLLRGSLIGFARADADGIGRRGWQPDIMPPAVPASSFVPGTIMRSDAGRHWKVDRARGGRLRWVSLIAVTSADRRARLRRALRDGAVIAGLGALMAFFGVTHLTGSVTDTAVLACLAVGEAAVVQRWFAWRATHIVSDDEV